MKDEINIGNRPYNIFQQVKKLTLHAHEVFVRKDPIYTGYCVNLQLTSSFNVHDITYETSDGVRPRFS